ncbi:ScyD/ScyE family protein [Nocardioides sp. SYSU DS0663]|uniref:ScyD/ScyE family protein n=1 Tax=Nocardioides sp. SYSU DS0663 TaxID=3416445 RepID=UPI003F4C3F69
MNRTTAASLAALALLAPATAALAAPTAPARSADAQVVANRLVMPLSLAVGNNGAAYVSQNFPMGPDAPATILRVKKGKAPKVVARASEGREIGALDVTGPTVTFAVSWGENEGGIVRQLRKGKVSTLGDIGAAEEATNPDGDVTYGFSDLPEDCEVPPYLQPYPGVVETHPYATARSGSTVYVADAGANAIFKIRGGEVTPVGALPAVEVPVSAEAAEALDLPECVVGHTVALEGVPTDVEVGRDGQLYVSSLPGGPEDGSLGANGAVYRMDPGTGETTKVAGGFVSTTGVAVAPNGDLYVSELFTGRILKVAAGSETPQLLRTAAMPAALEIKGSRLWATTNVMPGEDGPPNGKVMRFRR